jgi:Leucine-rich repeat (LRR) protein
MQKLNVEHNHIRELSPVLGKMRSLRELDLSYNELESLPAVVSKMENLRILDVTGNVNLLRLPPELFSYKPIKGFGDPGEPGRESSGRPRSMNISGRKMLCCVSLSLSRLTNSFQDTHAFSSAKKAENYKTSHLGRVATLTNTSANRSSWAPSCTPVRKKKKYSYSIACTHRVVQ